MNEKNEKKRRVSDLVIWLFCLLAAFIIWLYVMAVESPQIEKSFNSVPVSISGEEILSLTKGLSVVGDGSMTVDITVTGTKQDLVGRGADDFALTLDVSGLSETGKATLPVKVTLPSGLTLVSVSPASLSVYADNLVSATVPVRIGNVSAAYSKDYELGTPTPAVTAITVEGPESVVSGIHHAQLDLTLGEVSHSLTETVPVRLMDNNGGEISTTYLRLSQSEIPVEIPVYTVKDIPLRVSTVYGYYNESNTRIVISPASVTVKGDPETLATLSYFTIDTIDEKATPDNLEKNVTLILPSGVQNVDGIQRVHISLTHLGSEIGIFEIDNIKLSSSPANTYTVNTQSLSVTLRGTAAQLEALRKNPDAVSASFSLEGITSAGTYAIPVTIAVRGEEFSGVYELYSYTVSVTVAP